MGADLGTPANQGYLRNDSVTIAEALRASGYLTCMAGKWHVGGDLMAREVDSWRVGDFKLVRVFGRDWELYDMDEDRTELNDLAGKNAPLQAKLVKAYEHWAESVGVLDWREAFPRLQAA